MAPEEVEALLAVSEVDRSGLVRVKAQTEVTQDGSCALLGFCGLSLGSAQHHEVVGIADDFTGATFLPGPIECVQVEVGQEGRGHPSLGRPRARLGDAPSIQHPCLQPLSDQLQHPSVRYPLADQGEKPLVVNRAEEVPNVRFADEVIYFCG